MFRISAKHLKCLWYHSFTTRRVHDFFRLPHFLQENTSLPQNWQQLISSVSSLIHVPTHLTLDSLEERTLSIKTLISCAEKNSILLSQIQGNSTNNHNFFKIHNLYQEQLMSLLNPGVKPLATQLTAKKNHV